MSPQSQRRRASASPAAMQAEATSPTSIAAAPTPPPAAKRLLPRGISLFALTFWLYTTTKLFIFDLDIYAAGILAPQLKWILDFRFILLFSAFSAYWMIFGTRRVAASLLYTAAFPGITLLWKLPRLLSKTQNWSILIASLNATVSGARSARFALPEISAYLLLATHCLVAKEGVILLVSAILLIGLMAFSFLRRIVSLARRNSPYTFHPWAFTRARELFLQPQQQPAPKTRTTKKDQQTSSLFLAVIINRGCLFWSSQLRAYQKSNLLVIAHAFSSLRIAVASLLWFGAANFATHKWDSSQFSGTVTTTGFFDFTRYSFGVVTGRSHPAIVATGDVSQLIEFLQQFSVFAFLLVFASLYFDHQAKTRSDHLEEAISDLRSEAQTVESLIKSRFGLNINIALQRARGEEGGAKAKVLDFLSKRPGNARSN